MSLVSQDFVVAVNEDWRGQLVLTTAALTANAVAVMQIRPEAGHPDAFLTLASIGLNAAGVTAALSTSTKTFSWVVLADAMADLPPGRFAYDVLISDGSIQRAAAGTINAVAGVTRLGDVPGYVLREDGGIALREDGGKELRG